MNKLRLIGCFLSSFFIWILIVFKECYGVGLRLGIDVLQEQKFSILKKKKVALLMNTFGTNSKGELTLDIFVNSTVFQLKAVLLPEHDGNFDAKKLEELKKKGINVHHTHTAMGRSPSVEWFKDIDVVVADMADIGIRYFTYSASVLYAMAKTFEAGKEFVILDRPNPLGNYIGGPTMDKEYSCFLGPITGEPLFHGMTLGEKANYIKNRGENFEVKCNCGIKDCSHGIFCDKTVLKKGKLTVVKVKNWNRKKILTETGYYHWDSKINLSPWIQNVASIFEYAILSLLILLASGSINFINTHKNPKFPERNFKTLGSSYITSSEILTSLKRYPRSLTGCTLVPVKVERITNGKVETLDGLDLTIKNFSQTTPAFLVLVIYAKAQEWVPECDWQTFEAAQKDAKMPSPPVRDLKKLPPDQQKDLRKAKWDRLSKQQRELFFKHIGNKEFIDDLFNGKSIDVMHYYNKWNHEATNFYNKTKKYHLY